MESNPKDIEVSKLMDRYQNFDLEAWKTNISFRVEKSGENKPLKPTQDEYERFTQLNSYKVDIENQKIDLEKELAKKDDFNPELEAQLYYYESLLELLQKEMYVAAPVEFLSTVTWDKALTAEKVKYSKGECANFLYFDNCAETYDALLDELKQQYQTIQAKIDEIGIDGEGIEELKQTQDYILEKENFCVDRRNLFERTIPVDINGFLYISEDAEPKNLSITHQKYIEELTEKAKAIQAKQVDLLVEHENGDHVPNPRGEVGDLQKEFEATTKKITKMKNLGELLGISPKDKNKEKQEDDGIIRASGEDTVQLMTKKQKYKARQKIHEIQTKRAPGWIKKLTLKLPHKSMDAHIAEYIDSGKIDSQDYKDIMYQSREEMGVEIEAKRTAREEREREAEMLKLYKELSPEAKVEAYAMLFELDESEKEMLSVYMQLSPEAKKEAYEMVFGEKPDRDKSIEQK